MTRARAGFNFQTARQEGDSVVRRGLLEVARGLLEEKGPQWLTVRELTQRAHCSTKVVYTIFGGKDGVSEALYLEGFDLLRFTVEREARRHREPVGALLPVVLSYRTFALEHRPLFGVMFGTSLSDYVPSISAKQQASLALSALVDAVTRAGEAGGAAHLNPQEGAVRLWAAVHGPVCLELLGVRPFDTDGERLARAAVVDAIAGLKLAQAGR